MDYARHLARNLEKWVDTPYKGSTIVDVEKYRKSVREDSVTKDIFDVPKWT